MAWSESFLPQVNASSQVLILGSMPGIKSIEAAQYYAHPRNAFWKIMASLFCIDRQLSYEDQLLALQAEGVGLWDVYYRCFRVGSLDSAIDKNSAQLNDFSLLFTAYPRIHTVIFNGKAAESAFMKKVVPQLSDAICAPLNFIALPSTSPANAAMNVESKLHRWSALKPLIE